MVKGSKLNMLCPIHIGTRLLLPRETIRMDNNYNNRRSHTLAMKTKNSGLENRSGFYMALEHLQIFTVFLKVNILKPRLL